MGGQKVLGENGPGGEIGEGGEECEAGRGRTGGPGRRIACLLSENGYLKGFRQPGNSVTPCGRKIVYDKGRKGETWTGGRLLLSGFHT